MSAKKFPDTIYFGEASPTPLGPIWVAATDKGLAVVEFCEDQTELSSV